MPIIKVTANSEKDVEQAQLLENLYNWFWDNGGKEKYYETKAARDANRIPDEQWFKANLMGLIDDGKITLENLN